PWPIACRSEIRCINRLVDFRYCRVPAAQNGIFEKPGLIAMANCLNHKTKCNMTILCPTDFSSLATAACRVALRIASERGYNVHILHAYQQFRSAFQGQLENEADKERIRHEAHSEMKRFVGSLDLSGTKANVTYSLSEEDLVKAVHKYSEDVPVA